MTNYLKLFSSVAEQDAFRNGSDYVEPHVSCIEDGSSVKYNKRPLNYDIEINCNGQGDCVGQEILSMSSQVGPYELSESELSGSGSYVYSVTNPNLTTNPLQTLKVKIVNGPDNSDGVYECTYADNGEGNHSWGYSMSEDPFMYVHVDAYNNGGVWSLQAYLSTGC